MLKVVVTEILRWFAYLKPNFDLGLVELECRGDLYPSSSRQVFIVVELLLKFGQLFVGEVGAARVVDESRRRGVAAAAAQSDARKEAGGPDSPVAAHRIEVERRRRFRNWN